MPDLRRRATMLLATAVAAVWLVGCGASLLPAIHSEAERLAVARRLMAQREYAVAGDLLKTYIDQGAGTADVDQAVYLLGECYVKTKDWALASVQFERLLRDYPESDSSGAAAFGLAEATFGQARPADFDQENTVKALEQWRAYLRDFPGHWLNGEAERRIAKVRQRLAIKLADTGRLYAKLKLYEPARVYFTRIESDYLDLDVVGEAWLALAAIDAAQKHRTEAIARLRQVEERFPGTAIASRASHQRARLER